MHLFTRGRMRAAPTIAVSGTLSHLSYTHTAVTSTANNLQNLGSARDTYVIQITGNSSTTSNAGAYARIENASSALTILHPSFNYDSYLSTRKL